MSPATETVKRKKVAIVDASRSNIYNVDPASLTLVFDVKHPLYDKRVHLPIDEGMVASIIAHGVIEPVIVRKNGPLFEVSAGRQRTKNGIEANKRIVADGGTPRKIPVIIRNENDSSASSTNSITNYVSLGDDIVTRAEKANDARRRFSKSDAELAVDFHTTVNTIKTWAKLDTLSSIVQSAIRTGQVAFHSAVENLADLTREDQDEALIKLIESAPKKGGSRGGNKGGGDPVEKKESALARLRRLYRDEDAMAALSSQTRITLEWVFGKATHGDLVASNGRLSEFVSGIAKKKITGKGSKSAK
jgi:ParB family transcriptional regulator, chromosome partitioning protein